MVEKKISSYGDLESQSPFNSDKLIVNIGQTYMSFMVKLHGREDVSAFELFEFEKVTDNWYDVFYGVKTNSKILDRSYNNTEVLYNIPEAVLMPAEKYSTESADSFLTTVFGNNINHIVYADHLNIGVEVMNAYRIKRSLFDIVRTHFMMVEAKHYYTNILQSIFGEQKFTSGAFLRLEFFKDFFVLVLVNNNQLQLIQQFTHTTADDMLYFILSVLEQYQLKPENIQLEVAGFMDTKTVDYDFLRKIFNSISFDKLNPALAQKDLVEDYPAHYLSPFFKLSA